MAQGQKVKKDYSTNLFNVIGIRIQDRNQQKSIKKIIDMYKKQAAFQKKNSMKMSIE